MPQGWALEGWQLATTGAALGRVILPVAVMLVLGVAFVAVGVLMFQRRFE
jgi:hypothetical protein